MESGIGAPSVTAVGMVSLAVATGTGSVSLSVMGFDSLSVMATGGVLLSVAAETDLGSSSVMATAAQAGVVSFGFTKSISWGISHPSCTLTGSLLATAA